MFTKYFCIFVLCVFFVCNNKLLYRKMCETVKYCVKYLSEKDRKLLAYWVNHSVWIIYDLLFRQIDSRIYKFTCITFTSNIDYVALRVSDNPRRAIVYHIFPIIHAIKTNKLLQFAEKTLCFSMKSHKPRNFL